MSLLPLWIRAQANHLNNFDRPFARPATFANDDSPFDAASTSALDQYPYPVPPAAPSDDQKSNPTRTAPVPSAKTASPSSTSSNAPEPSPVTSALAATVQTQAGAPTSQVAFSVPTSEVPQTSSASSTTGISITSRLSTSTISFTTTPSTISDISPTVPTFHDHPLTSKFSTLFVPSPATAATGAEPTASPSSGPSSGLHLSTLRITLFSIGGLCAIGFSICVFRYLNRRKRHMRRLREQIQRGGPSGAPDKLASTGEKENEKESPVFGGRERSGMTPLPSSNVRYSWATFPDDAEIAAATAAVVGPPASFNSPGPYTAANHLFLPSRNYSSSNPPTSTTVLRPGHYPRSSSAGSISDSEIPQAVIKTAARRSFKPPRIMVTSSSPTADGYTGLLPASDSEGSAGETEFRLVAPPKLAVVNVPGRDSGCSWDESVGVQLGVRMQRHHQPPKAANKPSTLPRSPLSQQSPSGSPHVKGSPRTPGRNPGAKTQLLYDVPKLPATETEAAKVTRLHNTTSAITERYPLASQYTLSQDRRENLNRNLPIALGLDTPQHEHAYLPPLAVVNSGEDERLFLDTRPSSPTLSDSEAYAPSATTASVYTTHTEQHAAFRSLRGPASLSRLAPSATATNITDSVMLSPATTVGNAMLRDWDASPTPALPFPLPVSGAYGGGIVGGVARTRTQTQTQNVPSLPPVGQPSLRQLALMHEMPDYRSPTYSIYGMYSGPGTGSAADASASGTRQPLVTPGSAYGGLATTGAGVETRVGNTIGQRNGGAVPGAGLFGRIL